MSTLETVRAGVERMFEQVGEGWRHLRDVANHAITRFSPVQRRDEPGAAAGTLALNSARWGLLVAEVAENDSDVKVRLEIPGMDKNDFDIQVLDHALLVRGEKRVDRETTRGRYHIMECAYGRFERAIPLPAVVDESGATARYRKGVLEITLPKSKTGGSRRITVESA